MGSGSIIFARFGSVVFFFFFFSPLGKGLPAFQKEIRERPNRWKSAISTYPDGYQKTHSPAFALGKVLFTSKSN